MSSFRKLVTIKQFTGGNWLNGRWQAGSTANININASLQPADSNKISRIIETLPEGRKTTEKYFLYTSTKLTTLQEGENPDIALIDGKEFEILREANWNNHVINHYKYLISKIEA